MGDERERLADLSFYLHRAYQEFFRLLQASLKGSGLDKHILPGMGPVLFTLFERDECTIKDIVERTGLHPATLTGTLRRMKENRLIAQQADRTDRRAVRIKLTKLGRSLEPQFCRMHDNMIEIMEAGMGPGEVKNVKVRLGEIAEAMRDHRERSNQAALSGKGGRL